MHDYKKSRSVRVFNAIGLAGIARIEPARTGFAIERIFIRAILLTAADNAVEALG
jgi:hypothetical protein